MRRSRLALPLLAAPLLVLGACAGLAPALAATGQATTAGQASAAAAATPPAHYAAPYLQITSGDAGDMSADLNASGDKYYTLAFLIPQSGCTPE
jgi:chitinase